MESTFNGKIYQVKIHLLGASPMIWRRLLLRDDTNLADLHGIIQLVMGWENFHLHCFELDGKSYGINYDGGGQWFSSSAKETLLRDFKLRCKDKFKYTYNYFANWEVQIRLEKILDFKKGQQYPFCKAGNNAGPIEEVQNMDHFEAIRDLFSYPEIDFFKILQFHENIDFSWKPNVFKKKVVNAWLKKRYYIELHHQACSYNPDYYYYQEDYWKAEDVFDSIKKIYGFLKNKGIEFEIDEWTSGRDVCKKFLEDFLLPIIEEKN